LLLLLLTIPTIVTYLSVRGLSVCRLAVTFVRRIWMSFGCYLGIQFPAKTRNCFRLTKKYDL